MHWVGTSMGGLIGLGPGRAAAKRRSAAGAQRRRSGDRAGGAGAHRQLPRASRRTGRRIDDGGRCAAGDLARLRSAHARAVAGADAAASWSPTATAGSRTTTRRSRVPFRAVTPEIAAAGQALLWQSYDRSAARRCCCAAPSRTCCRTRPPPAMTQRGPKAELHEFAGVGHAPMLVQPDQVAVVREFLLRSG